ncbi:MAG: epoxyqueuosine reductase QueH [Candidatus Omnitrophica bacterium]|nr:epoxyqueuosine reductase QueH [Candidatus Omnitrophota bacterium]
MQENQDKVEGFYYNPNIHPLVEFDNRKGAVEQLSRETGLAVSYPEYDPKDFFMAVYLKEDNAGRCEVCWRLRLERTASEAKRRGFDAFTTTLLVSPYQNHELLKKIGAEIALREEIEFYYEDFRTGFRQAHAEAKSRGIYCQKYCGCVYSVIERYQKKEK